LNEKEIIGQNLTSGRRILRNWIKKGFFIEKQIPVNQTTITTNHSIYSGLKSGLIEGTAFLDLVSTLTSFNVSSPENSFSRVS
jgi:hypothetical protein